MPGDQMSKGANTRGYQYYWRSRQRPQGASAKQALEFSDTRLRPSVKNIDYLVLRARLRNIKRYLEIINKNDLTVLDIGGRIQPYRPLFGNRVESYIGIDPQLEGLTDVVAVGENLPFQDDSISTVVCTQVLSYVNNPEAMMDEIYRVLQPGGHLILTTPSFFPEHFDEKWRILPNGIKSLASKFNILDISPEGHSVAGIFRAINILFHGEIENWRLKKLASVTTVPFINLAGALFDKVSADTRCTANYDLLAEKPADDTSRAID